MTDNSLAFFLPTEKVPNIPFCELTGKTCERGRHSKNEGEDESDSLAKETEERRSLDKVGGSDTRR